ncbi:MAG: 50S ribosomal protein L32 [Candidatus Cloacimonetes bacterium]|nr:50S ribosomal protein L32 [Candidatus Cloacimonadota bacterium]
MPVPKRKTSRARRNKRRTHQKAEMPVWTTCPHCNEAMRPHNICEKCGHYKGKKFINIVKE